MHRRFRKLCTVIAAAMTVGLVTLSGTAANASDRPDFAMAGAEDSRSLRDTLKEAFAGFEQGGRAWNAEIEYSGRIENAYEVSRQDAVSRRENAEFATVERLFGEGEFQPMIGFGFGDVGGRFEEAADREGLALTGVLGGVLKLSEQVGAVMKYGYSVATGGAEVTGGRDHAHGVQFGLQIRLN